MDSFVARQPIFDKRGRAVAYELLYRSGLENVFTHTNPAVASTQTIADSMLVLGLDALTAGKQAFFNVTREGLVHGYAALLPKAKSVVEILESVEPDDEVIAACRRLHQDGYRLALDDFSYDARYEPLIELAEIIKVDLLATGPEERGRLVERFRNRDKRLLAEKVETHEEFEQARRDGFTLFQGYFFGKPKILSSRALPAGKLHAMQLLFAIQRPDVGYGELEEILKREASLCLKLLRYINSVHFSWRHQVDSIHRALVLLGETEIRRWATILALSSLAEDKPEELMLQALIRGRFNEALAPAFGLADRSQSLFLVGLLSLLDAMLDRPWDDLLRDVPLADDVRRTLIGDDGPLRRVHEYTLAYERADWDTVSAATGALEQGEAEVSALYLESLEWATRGLAPRTAAAN